MTKPKREHHVTPRLFLKGFVIPHEKPLIWVYKKGEPFVPGNGKLTNNPFKDSIKIAGVERDFYANPDLSGTARFEAFENDLEALEKPSNKILAKLVAGQPLLPAEKTSFAAYVIHFSRRGRAGREVSNSLSPPTILGYRPPDEAYEKFGLPRTAESRLFLQAVALNVALKPGYQIQMHQGMVNAAPTSFMAKALGQMTWHLLKAPSDQQFVTCDNPVFFDTSIGLGSSRSEMSFPISSQYALLASWWKLSNDFVIELSVDDVEEINRRTIHNAVRHVYAGCSAESIALAFARDGYTYKPISPASEDFRVMDLIFTGSREAEIKQLVELPLGRRPSHDPAP